ncbi:hypothetical protein FisN_31Hh029 [Fistulifera solaris]|jgi:hypothetical protein|uniref:Uncharacterized protein n=1 Tax=Fistulifera solaris TaxID=1519565 RepID=A0A1Z5JWB7_FISSO|nr:hypothetical protein FisN_31Hh029 [Fistulifera solaris]|eukprot:GAX18219.1 hypothetical protein FisN_31Hh029 [Fistulifera solaris]
MFSSLSTSLSNLYNNATFSINLSPQAILASYLSASLAEFLQVDSHLIETSLLTDQHVTLRQIKLKPRTVRSNGHASTITLTGTIQKIEFRWEWSTQSYISNVRLKVEGVHLQLSKQDATTEEVIIEAEENANLSSIHETNTETDWKAVYMQQIVDHLSVSVTDVQITIDLDDNALIVLGSGIDLTTKEQQKQEYIEDSTTLMQQMCLKSLSAYFERPNGEQIQLLDAFGYSASVHRVSGRRFVDGIMNGLIITGSPEESIQWYFGSLQVEGLLQLQRLLRIVEPDIDMSLPDAASSDRDKFSIFELPLPSMSILMDESIKLQFTQGALQYRTDGSECILQLGRMSAELKEEPLAVLNNLTIDVINSSVLLITPLEGDSDTMNVKISLRKDMLEAYNRVYVIYSEVLQMNKNESEASISDPVDDSNNFYWSLDIQGNTKLEMISELGWIQWTMDNLSASAKYGAKIPFDASWKCAHLSSSHGIIVDTSMMELINDTFHFAGSVDIIVASMDAATQFSEFVMDASSKYPGDKTQSTGLSCNIVLPKVNVVVLDSDGGMQMECENIEVDGDFLTIRGRSIQISTTANGSSSNYFSCQNVNATFKRIGATATSGQTVKVEIRNMGDVRYLSSVHVPSLFAEATIDPSNINLISDLRLNVAEAELTADFRSKDWSKQIESNAQSDPMLLPDANVSKINLTLHFIGGGITLENAKISLPEFQGNESTRSDTLSSHYVMQVKKRLPFLFTKANVAGVNVGDSLSSAVATMAVQSSLVGTLVGVVGKDGVGAAITAGKATRGATENERYHFGDFSKGIAASAKNASLSSTAAASSTYASENRVRLSSAAGSGVGMVAGMALAGPAGLIAGSILAGKAVGNAVERRFGDPKRMPTTSAIEQEAVDTSQGPLIPATKSPATAAPQHPANHSNAQLFDPHGFDRGSNTDTDATVDVANSTLDNHSLPSSGGVSETNAINTSESVAAIPGESSTTQTNSGGNYKFGNITRGIIARGKAARGANKTEGYKFGDFTRGFLG